MNVRKLKHDIAVRKAEEWTVRHRHVDSLKMHIITYTEIIGKLSRGAEKFSLENHGKWMGMDIKFAASLARDEVLLCVRGDIVARIPVIG